VVTAPLGKEAVEQYKIVEIPYKPALDFWLRLLRLKQNVSVTEQVSQRLGVRKGKSITASLISFASVRLGEVVAYPDLDKNWRLPALKACRELIQKENITAVISSSPPVTSHLIASELKKEHGISWIADFPHLWSQNNSYMYSSLRKMIDRSLELRTLSRVDALTTTSGPLAEKLRALHREKAVYVITHGFDPDTVNTAPEKLTDKFTITFTGSFGPVLRRPTMLLTALKELISEGVIDRDRLDVRFYGREESWVDVEVEKYGLSGMVKQYGRVPMPVAQAKQRESQLLFNPKWDDPEEPGIHSLKILEYLAARRPILATGKYTDVVDELLEETGAGVCTSSVAETRNALEIAYREYKSTGKVTWHGDEPKVNNYSQREMAGHFAQILERRHGEL
jgi:glycosyltransferase involved in cell wall biosynthesis